MHAIAASTKCAALHWCATSLQPNDRSAPKLVAQLHLPPSAIMWGRALAGIILLLTVNVGAYYHGGPIPDKAPTVPTELAQLVAMEALFDSTLGLGWSTNTNWKIRDVTFYSDPCVNKWYGVICEAGNIVGINLSNNKCVSYSVYVLLV